MKKWFMHLSKAGKVVVISAVSILGTGAVGAFADQSPTEPVTTQTITIQSQAKEEVKATEPIITTK